MTAPHPNWRPAAAWLLILVLLVLHHDFWQWTRSEPMLLGWAPLTLWFHVGLTILSILAIYLLSKWVWPEPPDIEPSETDISEQGPKQQQMPSANDNQTGKRMP